MVNFHNAMTFAHEFAMAVNVWHTMDGIFIWEFFTTLDYEWDIIRGHRPYRWTIVVYTITRIATLMAVILNIVGFDDRVKLNCQAWATMNVFFAYVSFGSASLLIVLRIIGIWNRQRIAVLLAMGVWLADVAFLIYGTALIRAAWSDESGSCILLNPNSNRINIVVSLASDVILLLIMLVGLLRVRFEMGKFGLGRVLWNQGLAWLFLATFAEVPPTVFMFLNLNEAMDLMFQAPNMVIMAIAATTMYRNLMKIGSTEVYYSSGMSPRTAVSSVPKKRSSIQQVPIKRISVQIDLQTDTDQCPTSKSGSGGLDVFTDPHAVTK